PTSSKTAPAPTARPATSTSVRRSSQKLSATDYTDEHRWVGRKASRRLGPICVHLCNPWLKKLLLCWWVAEDAVDQAGGFVEVVGGGFPGGQALQDLPAAGGEVVGDEAAVAAPPYGFGADHRGTRAQRLLHQPLARLHELRRGHVVGVAAERGHPPGAVG